VWCIVLQCVTVCCSALQCVPWLRSLRRLERRSTKFSTICGHLRQIRSKLIFVCCCVVHRIASHDMSFPTCVRGVTHVGMCVWACVTHPRHVCVGMCDTSTASYFFGVVYIHTFAQTHTHTHTHTQAPHTHTHTHTHTQTHSNTLTNTCVNTMRPEHSCALSLMWMSHVTHTTTACCNLLKHTATHCRSLHHTELVMSRTRLRHVATHCNTLKHTPTHSNTMKLTAAHCITLNET